MSTDARIPGLRSLVLATGNRGKLAEMRSLLGGCSIEVRAPFEFDIPGVEETGLSFVENAILKARHACRHSGMAALADDSGLEVDALQGRPGIYSARFAGADADDASNNRKLLELLGGLPDEERSARFHCVIALLRHAEDPMPLICSGTWHGRILHAPVGDNGFGYDPLFFVPEQQCSSAQLPPPLKNQLSHRGQALRALLSVLGETC